MAKKKNHPEGKPTKYEPEYVEKGDAYTLKMNFSVFTPRNATP